MLNPDRFTFHSAFGNLATKKTNVLHFYSDANQYANSAPLCITDRAGVQPSHSPSPRSTTLACSHAAVRNPSLLFQCFPPTTCNPCTYDGLLLIYGPQRDGRLSWLTHSRQFTHEVVTCKYRLGTSNGKFAGQ